MCYLDPHFHLQKYNSYSGVWGIILKVLDTSQKNDKGFFSVMYAFCEEICIRKFWKVMVHDLNWKSADNMLQRELGLNMYPKMSRKA